MSVSFFDRPILSSSCTVPMRQHALDTDGQLLDYVPLEGRRRSELITSVPKAKKKTEAASETS